MSNVLFGWDKVWWMLCLYVLCIWLHEEFWRVGVACMYEHELDSGVVSIMFF